MEDQEKLKENKKAEILKRRKAAKLKAIKKEKELADKKEKISVKDDVVVEDEKEDIFDENMKSEARLNAVASFERFNFYKDGYKKTLGILISTIFTLMAVFYSLYYSLYVYKAPNVYLPVNAIGQLIDPVPLSEALFTDNEIRKFASEAFSDLSNYNYVTVDNTYFSDISKWFTPNSFLNYKNDFKQGSEIKVVKEHFFVVSEITVKDATINVEESELYRAESNVYLWVVNIKSRRIYQNRTGFTYEDYDTRMIITRSPVKINEKGLAIHSVVNEKIDRNK